MQNINEKHLIQVKVNHFLLAQDMLFITLQLHTSLVFIYFLRTVFFYNHQ